MTSKSAHKREYIARRCPTVVLATLLATVVAALVAIIGPAAAVAAPAPFVALNYDVDPALVGCPSPLEFRSKVSAQLGYDPFLAEAPLVVNARVWQGEGGYEGALDWGRLADARLGERRFATPQASCHDLIPAMVFALSVQIQLMVVDPKPTPTPPSETVANPSSAGSSPAPAKVPAAPPTATLTSKPETTSLSSDSPPRPAWKAQIGVGGALGLGVAPDWTALGRLLLAIHNGRWRFELGAEGSLPVSGQLDTGERFSQRLWLGTAAACADRDAWSACAVTKLGGITARGMDLDKSYSPTGFVAQVGPRLGWSYLMGDHVGLLARIDGLFLLTPWTVALNNVTAWTMPRIGASAGIDFFIRVE